MDNDDKYRKDRETLEKAIDDRRPWIDCLEADRVAAGAFPGGDKLKVGDWVEHSNLGRCRISLLDDTIAQLESADGTLIQVPLERAHFSPEAIEPGGQRVFGMSLNENR